jgi:hypothetical protein
MSEIPPNLVEMLMRHLTNARQRSSALRACRLFRQPHNRGGLNACFPSMARVEVAKRAVAEMSGNEELHRAYFGLK